jgi:hypothetical protein
MNYPTPDKNPLCQCVGNPMRAFWCQTGHMLECHFPYDCQDAACGHLVKYDFDMQTIKQLEEEAHQRYSLPGSLYQVDELGNVTANVENLNKLIESIESISDTAGQDEPDDTPMASGNYFDPPDLPEPE